VRENWLLNWLLNTILPRYNKGLQILDLTYFVFMKLWKIFENYQKSQNGFQTTPNYICLSLFLCPFGSFFVIFWRFPIFFLEFSVTNTYFSILKFGTWQSLVFIISHILPQADQDHTRRFCAHRYKSGPNRPPMGSMWKTAKTSDFQAQNFFKPWTSGLVPEKCENSEKVSCSLITMTLPPHWSEPVSLFPYFCNIWFWKWVVWHQIRNIAKIWSHQVFSKWSFFRDLESITL